MAERVRVELVDDIDGHSIATTQVFFTHKGQKYRLDLTDQHVADFDEAMARWTKAATKLGSNGKPVRKVSARKAPKQDNAAIREWAAKKKIELSPRGKIPQAVVDRYVAEHK